MTEMCNLLNMNRLKAALMHWSACISKFYAEIPLMVLSFHKTLLTGL